MPYFHIDDELCPHSPQAILKSYVVAGSDTANPEKFLAYMVPSLDEVDMPLHELISVTQVLTSQEKFNLIDVLPIYVAVPVV